MYIHSPFDFPWNVDHLYKVSSNVKIDFKINPKVTLTDDNLRVTDPIKRKCHFSNEVELDYFKYYSQFNCELECYAKESQSGCFCTEYWIPTSMKYFFRI